MRTAGSWLRWIRIPTRIMKLPTRLLVTVALALHAALPAVAGSPGTAFSFPGRLSIGVAPANDSYDFRYSLHDAVLGGPQISSSVTVEDFPAVNGAFMAHSDFGP
jgi:hypothetical protein